jgi:subtilisin family serine protease
MDLHPQTSSNDARETDVWAASQPPSERLRFEFGERPTMKTDSCVLCIAALAAATGCLQTASAQPTVPGTPTQPAMTATSRLIVSVHSHEAFVSSGMDDAAARERSRRAHDRLRLQRLRTTSTGCLVLGFDSPEHALRAQERLIETGDYALVANDWLVTPCGTPDDPYFGQQWHLMRTQAPTAWTLTVGQRAVTMAMVDTGIDATHPDLSASLVPGYNAVDRLPQTMGGRTQDLNGHGTETAGVAAAIGGNGSGVCGVLWDVRLMPVRASNSPGGAAYMSDIVDGIGWSVANGAKVICVGYAGVRSDSAEYVGSWARLMGAVVVWPAENSGDAYNEFDWRSVVIVGGTTREDRRRAESCYGRAVDLAAPAQSIFTTRREGLYGPVSGNSYAGPQVGATLALMLSVAPELSPAQAESAMKLACTPLGSEEGLGAGLLNVAEAVRLGSRVDFNRDRFIDFFDYTGFVTAFERGEPRADINNDGFLDSFDYDWFIRLYEATW